ncbi:MAG: hypothetical protein J1E39_02100 [Eubacterium sp.]|nr:hypothetical protein [Eubacterium sp.]
MPKYINADELIKDRVSNDPVVIAAKCAPAADVQEVKHGKWSDKMVSYKDELFGDLTFGFRCSVCGSILNKTKYCGNCGAIMDGGEKE